MRIGRLKVSYELLAEALNLPEETRIMRVSDASSSRARETFEIEVANDPDLPEVEEGEQIPEVQFIATRTVGHFYTE